MWTLSTQIVLGHMLALGLGWLLGFTIRPRIKRTQQGQKFLASIVEESRAPP
jgi:hypothetical protein